VELQAHPRTYRQLTLQEHFASHLMKNTSVSKLMTALLTAPAHVLTSAKTSTVSQLCFEYTAVYNLQPFHPTQHRLGEEGRIQDVTVQVRSIYGMCAGCTLLQIACAITPNSSHFASTSDAPCKYCTLQYAELTAEGPVIDDVNTTLTVGESDY